MSQIKITINCGVRKSIGILGTLTILCKFVNERAVTNLPQCFPPFYS